ncbi:hypothetical protein Sfulv_32580 [Streptomyces fulvorobeus]|nr:hypothetical protein Sfulv_32580 [Streptomyces fulvorobeus]
MSYSAFGDHTEPEVVIGRSSWLWQRSGLSIAATRYARGVTVHANSSVLIELNRRCTRYEAMAGVDDLTMGLGAVRFSVFDGDGARLWRSPVVHGGDAAVPVRVHIAGQQRVHLVVEAAEDTRTAMGTGAGMGKGNGEGVGRAFDAVALADWAESRVSCT